MSRPPTAAPVAAPLGEDVRPAQELAKQASELARQVAGQVATVVVGADAVTEQMLIALLAGPTQALAVHRFEDLIALATEKRDLVIKTALERDVRLVSMEDGKLEVALEPGAAATLVGELSRKLSQWTGRRWMVVVSAEPGAASVKAQAEARRAELMRGVAADPLVQAVLNRFPGAQIVDVRSLDGAPSPEALPEGLVDDEAGGETPPDDIPDGR